MSGNSLKEELAAGNPWYTDDQFASQLGNPGWREVVTNRWRVFRAAIAAWQKQRTRPQYAESSVRLLDAGCGDGINLFGLSEKVPDIDSTLELVGVDYNPVRTRRAADLPSVTGIVRGSVSNLPIADACIDVVLCNHVLEHVNEDVETLKELRRVTRPGGLLLLGVPNEGCVMAQIRNRWVQPQIRRTTDHVHFYTESTLNRKIEQAGFSVVAVERNGFFLPHLAANTILSRYHLGRAALRLLGRLAPSQAGELIVVANRLA